MAKQADEGFYPERSAKLTSEDKMWLEMLRQQNRLEMQETGVSRKVVGAFGIVGEDDCCYGAYWVQTSGRKRSTADINLQVKPRMSNYSRDMFDSMFRKWDDVEKYQVPAGGR